METLVPLSQLTLGRDNVRKTNPLVDIPVLAALIKSQGLLQNLLVRDHGDGKYRIIDGKRRHAAIKLLIESGDWPKGQLIPVRVLTEGQNDIEVGLAANIGRVDMHPADTFAAFRRRVEDEAETPEAIALRFGYSVVTVRGFLKLANVSPRLMRDFKKDEVTLEQMKALAITGDHKRQEQAFYDVPEHMRSPRTLRRLLMEGRLSGEDRLVKFVGLETYEAAGGAVTRDLFGPDGECYVEDPGLLRQLASDKLEAEAEKLRGQGWKWVKAHPELTEADLHDYHRVNRADHGFDPAGRTAKLYAGVIACIDHDGSLSVTTGLLRQEDAKALAKARKPDGITTEPTEARVENGVHYSARLVEELTAIRTAVLRVEIAKRPDLALAIVVHDLLFPVFYDRWVGVPLTEIVPKVSDLASFMKETKMKRAVTEFEAAVQKIAGTLPSSAPDLWLWLLQRDRETLLKLLAHALAYSVNAVQYRYEKTTSARIRAGDRLAKSLDLDITKWWQADKQFLSQLTKNALLAVLAEVETEDDSAELASASKGDLVAAAERKLACSTWLPQALQCLPGDAGDVGLSSENLEFGKAAE